MSEDLNEILRGLKAGQNPTPGVGSSGVSTSFQHGGGTLRKDFGLHSMNESGNDNETP